MPEASGAGPRGLHLARSELLLGTDLAAKQAHAQRLAEAWVASGEGRRVVFVNGAPHGGSVGRPGWVGTHAKVEEPTELAHALGAHSRPDTLIVVDCLTLWLTASMMRAMQPDASDAYMATGQPAPAAAASIAEAVRACRGPLVIVGDGGEPPSAEGSTRDARRLLEALGDLQQQAAAACERVSLVAGGQVLTLKESATAA